MKDLVSKVLGKDSAADAAIPERTSRPAAPRQEKTSAAKSSPQPKSSDTKPMQPTVRISQRPKEATRDQVAKILSYPGQVLSMPGGIAALTDTQRQYMAVLGGLNNSVNILVVSKDYAVHHETSAARSHLRRRGISWGHEYLVDLEVIRKIYDRADYALNASGPNRGDVAQMQREFITLLEKAARVKASDIHLTVNRFEGIVRIRADGVMMKLQELTAGTALDLCQAAFAMADASDTHYQPTEYQGARVTEASLKGLRFPEGVQSVRLQFNPLPNGGRYMIARLLYAQKIASTADIDELGYAPNQIRQIKEMRRKPFGINIISGPTGSGKSTTLQRGLTALMRERPGINVVTIEDPPEYVIEGAAQLPVTNAKTAEERGEKFRQAITAALRSDPDVIMIGEIRDGASGGLAFEAGMTGHGVWASLHANDAMSILDRLRDMGVEDYKLADASLVTGLIGQRLVRKTNGEHAVGFDEAVGERLISEELAADVRRVAGSRLKNVRFAGTHKVKEVGQAQLYSGRCVVAETILPDQKFLDLIKEGRKAEAAAYWLNSLEGMTMLEHAMVLMCKGLLDPRELEDKVGLLKEIDLDRIDTVFRIFEGGKKNGGDK